MPVQGTWEDDGQMTFRIDVSGEWEANDLLAVLKQAADEAAGRDYAQIINYQSSIIVSDIWGISKLASNLTPENMGFSAVVFGSNKVVKTMTQFAQNLFAGRIKVRMAVVGTLDEARQTVAEYWATR
jgi:hypothetical protein